LHLSGVSYCNLHDRKVIFFKLIVMYIVCSFITILYIYITICIYISLYIYIY
jgi:hypothetical protein